MSRPHHRSTRRSALLALPLAALALAACGSDSNTASTAAPTTAAPAATAAPTTAAPADTAAPTTAAPADTAAATVPDPYGGSTDSAAPDTATGSVEIDLADTPLGTILVDGAGNTLYLFTKDTASASNCSGDCASNWPALHADGTPTLGTGLDAEDFGTITGTDGTPQVTFYGHPLYYFAGDAAPGDTNGQNIGSVWFVVDGEGNPVTA